MLNVDNSSPQRSPKEPQPICFCAAVWWTSRPANRIDREVAQSGNSGPMTAVIAWGDHSRISAHRGNCRYRPQEAIIVNSGGTRGKERGPFICRPQDIAHRQDGKVIFQDQQRWVPSRSSPRRRRCPERRKSTGTGSQGIMKGDQVSPIRFHRKDRPFHVPSFENVRKGKLLLDDTMDERNTSRFKKGWGSPTAMGSCYLNATHRNSGIPMHIIPPPSTSSIISFGKERWSSEKLKPNIANSICCFDPQGICDPRCLHVFFNSDGGYSSIWSNWANISISSPSPPPRLLNRGSRPNKFRIVAYGTRSTST